MAPTRQIFVLSALLTLSSASFALESLNEDSMDVVSVGGIGHLLDAEPQTQPVARQTDASLPKAPQVLVSDESLNQPGIENTLIQATNGDDSIDNSLRIRTNDATAAKVADISIRLDRNNDLTTSSGEGNTLRMNLNARIDSVSAMNARHSPEDAAPRGNYYVDQIQVNSSVVINGR